MKCALIVATAGRPALVRSLLANLATQTSPPCEVVLSAPTENDLPDLSGLGLEVAIPGCPVTSVLGSRGLSAQRNVGLDALTSHPDLVAFLDDDSVPRTDYFEATLEHFRAHPKSMAVSGHVVLEGADNQPALTEHQISSALDDSRQTDPGPAEMTGDLYGCSMTFRYEVLTRFRFDERLPLYSLFEDHDISVRMMVAGLDIYRDPKIVLVHRKDPSGGRLAGERFGYSWIMNWEYLRRKGTESPSSAVKIAGPVAKNAVLAFTAGDRHHRRARLRGNLRAIADIARGRITPERILDLQ